MQIFDISMTIERDMPVYKNKDEKRPLLKAVQNFSTGNLYESRIDMDMHTGTHIDAPLHMIPGGSTVEKLDIAKLITECMVLDLTQVIDKITDRDLKKKNITPESFVLLKTRNSFNHGFDPEFVYVAASGAEYLKNQQVFGVGIDALGIERAQPNHETHKILFAAGIIIIEGLVLSEVNEGTYRMTALPLKIKGSEAAPARVIIMR